VGVPIGGVPIQASAAGFSQFSPPSAEGDTWTPPGTTQARTTGAEGATARRALAGRGRPLFWTGPGWDCIGTTSRQVPPLGPENREPSGPSRSPVVNVSASIADVAVSPLLSPFVTGPTGVQSWPLAVAVISV